MSIAYIAIPNKTREMRKKMNEREFKIGDKVKAVDGIDQDSWDSDAQLSKGVIYIVASVDGTESVELEGKYHYNYSINTEVALVDANEKIITPPKFDEINHYLVYGVGCRNKSELFDTEKEALTYAKKVVNDSEWTGEIHVMIMDTVARVEKTTRVKRY